VTFQPENDLENALALAVSDPLARPAFYKLLMQSELIVMGRKAGEDLNIPSLRYNGRDFLPVFSAPSRFASFAGGRSSEHFTMAARPLFEITMGSHFALNPNSPCGKLLMAVEVAFWLDPSARAKRRLREASVRVTDPTRRPPRLLEALTILFRNRSSVASACLLEAAPMDGSEPPHPLIGIETNGEWSKIASEVSELAAAVAPEIIIDLMPIDRAAAADSVPARLAATTPFYTRTNTLN
jgi:SseB protein C-terminal domain/SseB protein N-terminal domain